MNVDQRRSMTRVFWIAGGGVLLIVTAIGASLAFNSGASGGPAEKDKVPPVKHNGLCLGYVDVEHGVAYLHPTQPGEVVAVREEGYHAKKGEWLLKIDDQLARLTRAGAEATLAEAKTLPEQHKLKVKQQQQVIEAAENRKKAADFDLSAKERELAVMESTGAKKQYEDAMNAAKARAKQIDNEIQIAKIDLLRLDLDDPNQKLKQAQALFDQADLAVKKCELVAPADGTLLRCMVHVGEALGANPKAPAVQFAQDGKKIIRAEILQEWAGRFKKDQDVEIEDDSYNGPKWSGKIRSISKWYAHKRSIVFEPFIVNDVRSLECIIDVDDPNQTLCIGQRVRVAVIQK